MPRFLTPHDARKYARKRIEQNRDRERIAVGGRHIHCLMLAWAGLDVLLTFEDRKQGGGRFVSRDEFSPEYGWDAGTAPFPLSPAEAVDTVLDGFVADHVVHRETTPSGDVLYRIPDDFDPYLRRLDKLARHVHWHAAELDAALIRREVEDADADADATIASA